MLMQLLKGKIHRAHITHCDLDYEGSLEIDPEILAAADILPYEKNADIHIDSLMPYELHLLRDPLTAVLNQLEKDSEYYPQALRLMEKIAPFEPIGEEYLPANSLYHEFLG